MRILIAETDRALLAEMQHALEQAGYEVTTANDGMGAWGHLTSTAPPDLLITRLHLCTGAPPGTALGLYAHACQPPIPVLYIPATPELAKLAAPEHGAVLVKPFAVTVLVATVSRLLNQAPDPTKKKPCNSSL